VVYLFHSERALAREESAFRTFSAACLVVRQKYSGFSPQVEAPGFSRGTRDLICPLWSPGIERRSRDVILGVGVSPRFVVPSDLQAAERRSFAPRVEVNRRF
jgi:hypothetical protein